MFRIDGPGAVGELPPVREGVSAPGFFGPGNPATGQMSTRVTYEWLNAVQEELVQVIRHAGIEPNKEDNAQLLKALKTIISDSRAEAWRKSMIGAAVMLPSPVLPDGYMWPDGTLASFEDWPELEEAYKAGKFEGYVLPASATDEDKAVWPGKWVLAADSAGLYTPRLSGLFARYCAGEGEAGAYHRDEIRNIRARLEPSLHQSDQVPLLASGGEATMVEMALVEKAVPMCYTEHVTFAGYACGVDASLSVPTGPENVPQHYRQSVGLYLGRLAQI